MNKQASIALAALVSLAGCRHSGPSEVEARAPERVPDPAPAPASKPAEVSESRGAETPGVQLAKPQASPEPDPMARKRARKRFAKGEELFREGRYDEAEIALKESLNLYPFQARANLILGKVFLIRGAAVRDQSMIESARLMFKMAKSLDPELHEVDILLSLFDQD